MRARSLRRWTTCCPRSRHRAARRRSEPAMIAPPVQSLTDGHYGFGGSLSPKFPSQVIIDVTELCNLACTHCPHPDFKKSPHYAGRTLDPVLNRKAIGEVADAGAGIVKQVRYTSEGEPLLH